DLPPAEKSLDNLARTKWRGSVELTRQVAGKTKRIWKYHISLLPEAARLRLEMVQLEPEDESPEAKARREIEKQLWARFNA
ncbi:transposase, partial [Ochrobactrum sp. SFR4]|nr:transposase [Ochrobactrum sp. SFR4]